jgi:hypothetical protein
MIKPDSDEILASVIGAVEDEVAPLVASDEYAASLCRTIAQMLRHVRVRTQREIPALAEDNAELRDLLDRLTRDSGLGDVVGELPDPPAPRYPDRDELMGEAFALRAALVRVIEAVPDEHHPARAAGRAYLDAQLRRQLPWQQDAYTGPRR